MEDNVKVEKKLRKTIAKSDKKKGERKPKVEQNSQSIGKSEAKGTKEKTVSIAQSANHDSLAKEKKKKKDVVQELSEPELPKKGVKEKAVKVKLPTGSEQTKISTVEDFSKDVKAIHKQGDLSSLQNQVAMYEKTMKKVQQGNIVQGTIIRVNSNEILVNIGFKAEGVIPLSEFKSPEEAKKGNKIWVYIVRKEDRQGRPRLSKRMADEGRSWMELEDCYKIGKLVSGKIIKRIKGGMIVDINGIEAFLPASQLSTKTLPNLNYLVGKELEFKIIRFNREKQDVVLSHKVVIEEKLSMKKSALMEKLQVGIEVDGIVKNIMDYGVFIDLGGIDGLLHISDMSWGHISHPSEMLNIGDKVKVKILSFDRERERVSLGLKQLVPHPWENIEIKYPEGSKVEGRVTNITNYGAFVELEKGVEGLIHISEMSWTQQITHPKQLLKVGDMVNVIVLSVDKEQHRISLGLKQIEPNPWLTIDIRHPVGSKITGRIKNITNFGTFVEVEKDIDGLIHISDLSWTKRILHPSEVLKKGHEVTAVVLSIDKVMQRIALGIKQLTPDPWENVEESFSINSEHTVRIIKIIPKGALVSAKDDIEGFVPSSHLGIPGLESPQLAFDIGEELPVKVIEVDRENRRLIFSVKTFFFGREEKEINDFVSTHLEKIKTRRKEKKVKEEEKTTKKEYAKKKTTKTKLEKTEGKAIKETEKKDKTSTDAKKKEVKK